MLGSLCVVVCSGFVAQVLKTLCEFSFDDQPNWRNDLADHQFGDDDFKAIADALPNFGKLDSLFVFHIGRAVDLYLLPIGVRCDESPIEIEPQFRLDALRYHEVAD